jgi:CheY-like chemotaxis protein
MMPALKPSLLVVDDEALIRMSLLGILIESGYAVRIASDGFAALAEIREKIPDLILSDLNMPGMSGFELLSVVRRRFPSLRVIAMSTGFRGPDLPLGVAADAFYEKAAHPKSLLRIVEDVMRPGATQVVHRPRSLAPIWVPASGHNARGESYITIPCPECLRAFSQILPRSNTATLHTTCSWCHFPINFAIVRSALAA